MLYHAFIARQMRGYCQADASYLLNRSKYEQPGEFSGYFGYGMVLVVVNMEDTEVPATSMLSLDASAIGCYYIIRYLILMVY